jgi:hypothetical protein
VTLPLPLPSIAPSPIVQIAWQVDDVDAAAARWVKETGAGPFFVKRHIELASVTYRGEPAAFDHSAAVGWWGNVEVELMQQHCDNPSALRDMFAPGETGIASLTWFTPDIEAEIRRMNDLGFATVQLIGDQRGVPVAWFDTRPLLGTMAEVYQDEPVRRARKLAVQQAAEGWDGTDPLRPGESLAAVS